MGKEELLHRISANFPQDLQQLDQWVTWRIEGRNGKPTKVPYTVNGSRAASDNPATWASFDAACNAYLSDNYNGVGFMFSAYDPYAGVDFDKCITGEVMDPTRWAWVQGLSSYTERSYSRTGAHTIVIGKLPPGGRKSTAKAVEMYDSLRFFVVTGDHMADTPTTAEHRQNALTALHAEIFPIIQKTTQRTVQPTNAAAIPQDDQALLQRMFASAVGPKIQALWNGDTSAYNGDHSAADMALCSYLNFWTGNDPQRVDRLFRMSELCRGEKWDRNARRGETYGAGTIQRAQCEQPFGSTHGESFSGRRRAMARFTITTPGGAAWR